MKIVLIVEDNFPNYLLIKTYLAELNFVTLLAKNGLEAVDYVRNTPDIAIVLMDLQMQEMDGFYATKIIKSIRPELPIIAQTAFFYSNVQDSILDQGFSDYLHKPYSAEEMIESVNKYIL